ncbi:hypothetical protein RD792_003299 [Penstemon davidsonii]|uniref:Uncharacterized protein n=1 Tax=Penstemon davidsonii TaxID=160366 RepID=A0ABR0DUC2_9LAMI|nr:hypothetical protein RD792_003299 [Penstemon davidsonii]
MMSLISQNATSKDQVKKKKTDNKDEEGKEAVEDGNELNVDAIRIQRRKRGRKENEDLTEIEQEKEMNKLENFLFGSLYTTVEFGRNDDREEAISEVDNTSALFFTDRSGNSVLPVYKEDMESGEDSTDEVENKPRKPVWTDEEEEKPILI